MITKQLKSLLMIPSPNALRPRSHALPPEAAAGARAAAEVDGAARQEPSVPLDPGGAPRALGELAPGRAPAVPSYLRAAPKPAEPASLVPPGMRGFGDLRGTHPVSGAASTAPVLPFGPPALPTPATPAAETAVVPRGMRGFTSLTGTHPTSGAPSAAVLPFSSSAPAAPSSPPSVPALSLEQYASLCAELAVAPGDAEALFGRYGLGQPDARLAVDRFWRDRLARDEAAHRRWQELYWQQRARCSAVAKSPHEPR
ncbi:hypothetical protein AB3662_13300 [Sorangium cellulosum]|uniref:hypothetical protein n=1 Tax=Sorangium cellulosum TaxID=56 RepID=UPI003D9A8792